MLVSKLDERTLVFIALDKTTRQLCHFVPPYAFHHPTLKYDVSYCFWDV